MILNFRQAPPSERKKHFSIMPFQTLSKQSEVTEYGITRLEQHSLSSHYPSVI